MNQGLPGHGSVLGVKVEVWMRKTRTETETHEGTAPVRNAGKGLVAKPRVDGQEFLKFVFLGFRRAGQGAGSFHPNLQLCSSALWEEMPTIAMLPSVPHLPQKNQWKRQIKRIRKNF